MSVTRAGLRTWRARNHVFSHLVPGLGSKRQVQPAYLQLVASCRCSITQIYHIVQGALPMVWRDCQLVCALLRHELICQLPTSPHLSPDLSNIPIHYTQSQLNLYQSNEILTPDDVPEFIGIFSRGYGTNKETM